MGHLAWSLILLLFLVGTANANNDNDADNGLIIVNENGSFEDSELGVVDTADYHLPFWELYLANGGDATFEIVDDPVQHGERAVKLTVHELGDNAWDIQVSGYDLYVEAGASYTFSMWARAEEPGAIAVFSVWHLDHGEFNALRGGFQLPTDEWQEYTFDFSVPESAEQRFPIRVPVHFSFPENVDKTIYVDNLQIVQTEEAPARRKPIVLEVADAEIGADFEVVEEVDNGDSITYVYPVTDNLDIPGSEDRLLKFDVFFPYAGEYDLFARVRTDVAEFDSDSFFYPDSLFTEPDPASIDGWIVANGLVGVGASQPHEVVTGESSASGDWRWINISQGNYHEESVTYHVFEDSTTVSFWIGAREDETHLHKFAFGRSDLFFTVSNLNNVTPGYSEFPDDPFEIHPGPPIADGQDKWIGNIWSPPQIANFANYWNQVTAENAGKWGSVEGTRGTYNWTNLDASYQLARDNGFPYRFHVLTWGGQQPGWINDLSTEEQLEAITQWYDTLAVRYPDMEYVEVVNEGSNNHQLPDGISGDANYIEALGGTGETGHDWIITAFEMARERFPNSKLMINDYNIVSSNTWGTQNARNYRRIIEDLMERDLIDVIGVQAHAFSTPGSQNQIRSVLDYLAETGLPIQATEMDIQGNSSLSQEASDQLQLENMQRIFPVFWEHPAVEGITFWGWRPGIWMDDAELIYPNGEERPALKWLIEYVQNWVPPAPTDVRDDATPVRFELSQNYPNPFNPTTQIRYEVAEQADVSLQVYDITGRLVQTLVNNTAQAPGQYSVTFDGSNLASGVYLYRLQAGSFSDVRRMMLVK
ncbi:endo-1,4-beta-xylanase [Balneolales bacterium ANBcel1]|nr:endo-1,4-beta-xylanase [Balneolales bacterium ANBcel1]